MNWPTSQDYNEAIQNTASSMSDPDLKNGCAVVNAMGLPVPRSGNFADVYQFKGGDGQMWAVKCFTRYVEGLQERYSKIDAYLSKAELPFTVGFQYLAEGMRIRGKYYPILKMEWVEGLTLNEFVRQNADKPKYLHGLMQMWAKLTGMLRDSNIAHADLQHGNVLLVPGNTPSTLGLKLIDYDGMWVPPLADHHSGEVGHPNFQHPLRLKEKLFNADVDRFPHLVIAAALRATVLGGQALWDKYDNGDNLLFREQHLRDPANAKIFKALWELNDQVLCTLVGHIALSSKQPLRKTPWLDDILLETKGPRLSPDEEKQVEEMLGVRSPAKVVASIADTTIREEFSDFANLLDDGAQGKAKNANKESAGFKSSARKPPLKKQQPKEEAKKSKLPFLIGGGVLMVALIGGIVAFMASGKRDQTHVVQNDNQEEKEKPKEAIIPRTTPKDPRTGKLEIKELPKKIKELPNETEEATKEIDESAKDVKTDQLVRSSKALLLKKPVAGIAVISKTKDYLFIEEGEPYLYGNKELTASVRRLGKHNESVRALACSPDGGKAVTGGDDATLRVWVVGERVTRRWLSPDGDFEKQADGGWTETSKVGRVFFEEIASNAEFVELFDKSRDMGVRLHAGKMMLRFPKQKEFKFFRNGDWDPRTPEEFKADSLKNARPLYTLKVHTLPIVACAVSPDGDRAVSVGTDDLLCEWDIKFGKLIRKFKIPAAGTVTFLADGKKTLLGTQNESAGVWDLEKQQRVTELPGHVGAVRAVCADATGLRGATGGEDGVIRYWDLGSGAIIRQFDWDKEGINGLAIAPNGRVLGCASPKGRSFWDLGDGKFLGNGGGKFQSRCIAFCDDGQAALVGAAKETGGLLAIVQPNLSAELLAAKPPEPALAPKVDMPPKLEAPPKFEAPPTLEVPPKGNVLTLARSTDLKGTGTQWFCISKDGKYFCTFNDSKSLEVADCATGKKVGDIPTPKIVSFVVFGKGTEIYILTMDCFFQAWDFQKSKLLHEVDMKEKYRNVDRVLPTFDETRLLVKVVSGHLIWWDIAQWKEVDRIRAYASSSSILGVDSEGKRMVFSTNEGKHGNLRVWDLSTMKEVSQLGEKAVDIPGYFEFSPNGKWLVGLGNQVYVWEVATGKQLHTIPEQPIQYLFKGFTSQSSFFMFRKSMGPLVLLDVVQGRIVRTMRESDSVLSGATLAERNLAVATDGHGRVHIWRMRPNAKQGAADLAKNPDPKVAEPKPKDPMAAPKKKDGENAEGLVKTSANLSGEFSSVAFSLDGKKIFAATGDKMFHVLDAATLEELEKQKIPGEKVRFIGQTSKYAPPTGAAVPPRLILFDEDKRLRLFELEKFKMLKEFNIDKIQENGFPEQFYPSIGPDGFTVMIHISGGFRTVFWDTRKWVEGVSNSPLLQNINSFRSVEAVSFSHDGKVGAAMQLRKIAVWNTRTGQTYQTFNVDTSQRIDLISEASVLLYHTFQGKLRAWNYINGKELWSIKPDQHSSYILSRIPGKAGFVTAGIDRNVTVWDAAGGTELARWKCTETPLMLAVSPDGKFAVTGQRNSNKLNLWALPNIAVGKKP